ncbi:hypothetical protein FRX31_015096 [Thalictrum thalictroides]|uniref:Non-specific lipid-transfer protein n=1 Tax=Thalictrum thalictroides TaxID=46969 RepID=A0A7J6WGT5_THATH|nr:hypothetical protein FRX31_015096 [Thalictrum thalictroides]
MGKYVLDEVTCRSQWVVGDGSQIDLWRHNWLGNTSLKVALLLDRHDLHGFNAKVQCLVEGNEIIVPTELADVILSAGLDTDSVLKGEEGEEDYMVWCVDNNGCFSVKSAFDSIRNRTGRIIVASVSVVLCLLWVGVVDHLGFQSKRTVLNFTSLPCCWPEEYGSFRWFVTSASSAMVQVMVKPSKAGDAFTCVEIANEINTCTGYMIGDLVQPIPPCCISLREIRDYDKNDARTQCNCMKDAFSTYQHIIDERLASLLKMCNVTLKLPFPLSKNMDCNSIP